jgi:Domain of unknown function (DUF4167)
MSDMRPQYSNNNNNKNRNRNRNNNRRPNGGGGGQGGGNGANRVYDSNGPDVKVRGTAQTIAEKYMQLARDAQSSGDIVAAESYYQFSDHYYRVWLAAQPVGQPIQFSRRNAEDEYDEDGNEISSENEQPETESNDAAENNDTAPVAEATEPQPEGDGYQPRQNNNRNFNNNNNQNRDGRNNRQRWPRRNDRYNQDGQPNQAEGQNEQGERPERPERQERFERPAEEPVIAPREAEPVDKGNWEAPSFLTRPVPVIADAEVSTETPTPAKRGRKPRVVAAVEDAPQGE